MSVYLLQCNAQCDIFRKQDCRSLAVMRAISFDYRANRKIKQDLKMLNFGTLNPRIEITYLLPPNPCLISIV